MRYLRFPALGQDLSRLVLGTVEFDSFQPSQIDELMSAWLDVGGNIVDCAHVYGNGQSERALGRWLAERGARDRVFLLTKGAHHNQDRRRVTPEDIVSDLRDSLARLRTEVIDLYLLHRDDPAQPVGPIVEALNGHLRSGRIRAFGASNWSTERLEEANNYAAERGLAPFSCSSPHLSLARQSEPPWQDCISAADPESRAWYLKSQLPVFAWSSQAGGFFTDRYRPDRCDDSDVVRVYYSWENWERRSRAEELGQRKGCTANQVALAWVLHQPFPTYALIGPRSVDELYSSLKALDVQLSAEEVAWLDLATDTV